MDKDSKTLIFGGSGLLGSAVKRVLYTKGLENVLAPRSKEVNLLEKAEVKKYLNKEKPEYIFMTAGLVGGIVGNSTRPADFLYENSMMILNLLESAREVSPNSKILYTGSNCIYPKENPQPIKEGRLMAGKLEDTNKGYAVAKILGVVGCELYRKQYGLDVICAMPTNLYGLNDNYDLENGHMIAGLIKKFLLAKEKGKEIILWGTGNPIREALYSEDCADALVYLMENYSSDEIVNIGPGFHYSIKEFAEIIGREIGIDSKIKWDSSKPDGTFEKRTDIERLKSIYPDFKPRSFIEGLRNILSNEKEVKKILS
ncbi:GDP-L-fucose synthase [archaeon]|jgi:GDP-L-fucose synthase|nr:GDP-L-fucose synthase [archaeon]